MVTFGEKVKYHFKKIDLPDKYDAPLESIPTRDKSDVI